jgi:hypothetical protein
VSSHARLAKKYNVKQGRYVLVLWKLRVMGKMDFFKSKYTK